MLCYAMVCYEIRASGGPGSQSRYALLACFALLCYVMVCYENRLRPLDFANALGIDRNGG